MQLRNNLDCALNQLLNARLQLLGGDPSNPVEALFYWNSATKHMRIYDGTSFQDVPLGAIVTSHHSLTDLTNYDDHTQYVHVGTARTITATHTFNPGSAGPAFALGANATGQLIPGLNADKLDGIDSTGFALVSHTHTASQVTDLSTVVHAYTLDSFAAPVQDVSLNNHKITNLATPVSNTDAVTKQYVDALSGGLDPKESVRVILFTNVNTAAAPSVADGVTLALGNRVILAGQTDPTQNGIYVVNTVGSGSNGVWARSNDAVQGELTSGAYALVVAGTYTGTSWFVTTQDPITVGTTAITWSQYSLPSDTQGTNLGSGTGLYSGRSGNALQFRSIGAASTKVSVNLASNVVVIDVVEANLNHANIGGTTPVAHGGTGGTDGPTARAGIGATGKYAATIGDGSTLSFTINHQLNTMDVVVAMRKAASTYDMILADWKPVDANNVQVTFSTAPSTNEIRVVVVG
jgi:hypothetical protein